MMKNYFNPRRTKLWLFLTIGLLMQMLFGCQSSHNYPAPPVTEQLSPSRVTLLPGDNVEVKFFYTPQLNETQTIRPDGKIALQLIGEVDAQEMPRNPEYDPQGKK